MGFIYGTESNEVHMVYEMIPVHSVRISLNKRGDRLLTRNSKESEYTPRDDRIKNVTFDHERRYVSFILTNITEADAGTFSLVVGHRYLLQRTLVVEGKYPKPLTSFNVKDYNDNGRVDCISIYNNI